MRVSVCVCVCVDKPVAVELRCHATALIGFLGGGAKMGLMHVVLFEQIFIGTNYHRQNGPSSSFLLNAFFDILKDLNFFYSYCLHKRKINQSVFTHKLGIQYYRR